MEKVTEVVSLETLSGACIEASDRTEQGLQKCDALITNRMMRLANHAAALFTLKALVDKAGMSISFDSFEFNAAAESFVGVVGDLEIASWCYNIWAICAALQLCSVARSALADKDELNQADITSMAVTNFFVARMIGSDTPLRDTVIAAIVSGHAMRNNVGATSKAAVSLHTAAVQLTSAFLTTVATLGVVSAVAALLPSIPIVGEFIPNLGPLLGVIAMYAITNRAENGTIKEIVNGVILGGIAYNAIIGGITFALDVDTILSNITLVFLLYVTYQALDNARRAIFDL